MLEARDDMTGSHSPTKIRAAMLIRISAVAVCSEVNQAEICPFIIIGCRKECELKISRKAKMKARNMLIGRIEFEKIRITTAPSFFGTMIYTNTFV